MPHCVRASMPSRRGNFALATAVLRHLVVDRFRVVVVAIVSRINAARVRDGRRGVEVAREVLHAPFQIKFVADVVVVVVVDALAVAVVVLLGKKARAVVNQVCRDEVARFRIAASKLLGVTNAVFVVVGGASSTADINGIFLVAVAIAIAFRLVKTAARVDVAWSTAHPTNVKLMQSSRLNVSIPRNRPPQISLVNHGCFGHSPAQSNSGRIRRYWPRQRVARRRVGASRNSCDPRLLHRCSTRCRRRGPTQPPQTIELVADFARLQGASAFVIAENRTPTQSSTSSAIGIEVFCAVPIRFNRVGCHRSRNRLQGRRCSRIRGSHCRHHTRRSLPRNRRLSACRPRRRQRRNRRWKQGDVESKLAKFVCRSMRRKWGNGDGHLANPAVVICITKTRLSSKKSRVNAHLIGTWLTPRYCMMPLPLVKLLPPRFKLSRGSAPPLHTAKGLGASRKSAPHFEAVKSKTTIGVA